jgi:Na+/glutamate symporter
VEFSLHDVFWAGIVLAVLPLISRMIRQNTTVFRKVFLPSSIIAGTIALVLGPEVLPAVAAWLGLQVSSPFPDRMVAVWAAMPGILINVVFAALLMGKPLPTFRQIWHHAGPQVCFGQTVAWGQYVVGILLTILVLTPVFGLPAAAGALIEVAFEGGHGTAAGMGEAFAAVGWPEGQDMALGLATVGLVGGVIIGTLLINWQVGRGTIQPGDVDRTGAVPDLGLSSAEITPEDLAELERERRRAAQPTDPLSLLSIMAIGRNLGPFVLLAAAGIAWSVLAVIFIAPRIIPTGWFERGVGDFGQSMGVTVTGLLLIRVADPPNKSGALESFGYKQLLFEPIVGGGLFTGASVALLMAFGTHAILGLTTAITIFWIVFGLVAFGRMARENRAAEETARRAG